MTNASKLLLGIPVDRRELLQVTQQQTAQNLLQIRREDEKKVRVAHEYVQCRILGNTAIILRIM